MKKKIAAIALSSVIAVSGLSALSAGVSAEWVKSGTSYSYKDDDGNVLKGWQEIDGGKYYFDKDGKALTGWKKIGGKTYYFNGAKKGRMVTGTVKIGGKTYSFGADGVLKGEVKASTKSAASAAPVKWGVSHDAVVKTFEGKNYPVFMDLQMFIIAGDEDNMKMYMFDENDKLNMYGVITKGNSLASYKKTLENGGYKLLQKVDEDGATGYVFQKGNDIAMAAYGEEDGEDVSMIIYFSPELGKELLKEMQSGEFDASSYSSFLS